eukprot:9684590-Alexandrium_andersonii.AAC.1
MLMPARGLTALAVESKHSRDLLSHADADAGPHSSHDSIKTLGRSPQPCCCRRRTSWPLP